MAYTFFDMLKDIVFNGNKVSKSSNYGDDDKEPSSPSYSSFDSTSSSRDFNPSDASGEAFRSIFGDDN